ncbi:hypothetical protein GLOIN_2v1770785 [Rhizophagus irregularis DAOM 181602=DAOM 197198]|uniref:Uncharacterized protein n=1 Tax=Rhizophagus irregularis (strain DAOM 181602 / DAOM 197198 / MUCL 43194) TaxID=747089 RepID=A0A2P4QBF4_RHIID|nr:hypothetical protein GLOIN_2v1770785 [Rhizophagus irregularis DAOM 181602=DAOM 197198]POG74946.1 hypothetical protein GLOIN_2v1770785 [Rhizophagus irregularis DAOM 181602=DAOM 197198]|eukprot:XP_025181812.1 hypothetical protein GLOIN_2v1770785 [Rhizophagus irregularis DAOM 181602=DAOM 197198]
MEDDLGKGLKLKKRLEEMEKESSTSHTKGKQKVTDISDDDEEKTNNNKKRVVRKQGERENSDNE